MINTKIVLQKKSTNKDGKHPLKLCFNFKKKQVFINLKIAVSEKDFNNGTIKGTEKHLNNIISAKKLQIDGLLQNLELKGELNKFTPEKLKKYIESGGVSDETDKKLAFRTLTEKYITDNLNKKSSIDKYKFTLSKIAKFCNLDNLYLCDINFNWLTEFDAFCTKSGMAVNGKGIYLRCIRAVFNFAINLNLISFNDYPFRRFKIKRSQTKHRNVSIDDLRAVINFDSQSFIEQQKQKNKHISKFPDIEKYRDVFLLSFYLCGLNLKDLLFLTAKDIQNNTLNILREKTGIPIVLKIEPEAQVIIDRYKGQKYLLSFLDTYQTDDYLNFIRRVNKSLRHIFPYLSIYWARHTWATIAAELDIPDSIIDLAMGHKLQGMSAIYINRNRNKVFEANRKVIDYVLV